jgi:threonine/homoserine efflux transporter RhtA
MNTKDELRGIEGWLWWFIYIVLGVVGVGVNSLFAVVYLFNHQLGAAAFCVPFIAVAGLGAFLMSRGKTSGVVWAKVYLFASFAIGVLALIYDPSDPVGGVKLVGQGTVWLAYLFMSKRVRNTYRAKSVTEQAAALQAVLAVPVQEPTMLDLYKGANS